jgi:hypothetical protein
VFPEKWLGQGGPTAWSSSSSDLSFLDFYPCENLKSTVYAVEASDVQDLQQIIQNGSAMILTTPGVFQRVRQSLFRHAKSCVETQSGQFEHLI